MTEALDELIQRVLDGDATPVEKLRLEQRLASDAHARNRYDELARVFEALSDARLDEAPAGLRDDVLRSVREAALARTPAAARTGAPAPRAARPAFSWFRLALPMAAGAVAIAILFASFGGPLWRGGDRVSGTMAPPAGTGVLVLGEAANAVSIRALPATGGCDLAVTAGAVAVTLRLASADGAVTLAAATDPAPPARELEFGLAAGETATIAVRPLVPGARVEVRVSFPDGRVRSGFVPVGSPPTTR